MNTKSLALGSFAFALLALCGWAWVSGAYIAKTLQVKKATDSSMSQSITVRSSGDDIVFTMSLITDAAQPNREYKVGLIPLPSWLVANGYTIDSDTCADINPGAGNLMVDSQTNGNFVFRYKPTGTGICESIVSAKYTTSWVVAGTYSISYTLTDSTDGIFGNGNDSATTSNNISLIVKNTLVITNAKSFDTDADGFLDGYSVTFNNPLPATLLNASQIAVSTDSKNATGIGFSGVTGAYSGTITFADGLFVTDETPKIQITGDATYETATYFVGVVEDKAPPAVTSSPAAGTFTSSQNVSLSLNESGTLRYVLTGTANASSPVYTGAISITSPTTISIYATDLSGNAVTTSRAYAFACAQSAPVNGSITAYPGCVMSCNSGYALSGTVCIETTPPVISVSAPAGNYSSSQSITISLNEPGTIRYSLTGNATASSPVYTGAIVINAANTLSVYATDTAGNVTTGSYAYTFSCAQSAPTNGTIGGYPGCSLSCNSGYTLVGSACVATAAPTLSVSPPAGTYTGAISVGVTLSKPGTIRYALSASASASSPVYTGAISISNPTTLNVYAVDTLGNVVTGSYSYGFSCAQSAPANGSITAYPSCVRSCYGGYIMSGGVCIVDPASGSSGSSGSSGGGGGGGGGWSPMPTTPVKDTCPNGDLSGNLYDGKCTAPSVGTGTTTGNGTTSSQSGSTSATGGTIDPLLTFDPIVISWIPNSLGNPDSLTPANFSGAALETVYFRNLSEARTYLISRIQNRSILAMSESNYQKLTSGDTDYLASLNAPLFKTYTSATNAYVAYHLGRDAIAGGDSSATTKQRTDLAYKELAKGMKTLNAAYSTYVTRAYLGTKGKVYVYRTKSAANKARLRIFETKTIAKLYKLKTSGTISDADYKKAIEYYNGYILNYTIGTIYQKNPAVEKRVTAYLNLLMKTHNLPIKTPVKVVKKVKDVYAFSVILKEGDRSADVTKLQEILKQYGYFGTLEPTGYFWSFTTSSLKSFSKNVLGIQNPSGTLDAVTQDKLGELEWKGK